MAVADCRKIENEKKVEDKNNTFNFGGVLLMLLLVLLPFVLVWTFFPSLPGVAILLVAYLAFGYGNRSGESVSRTGEEPQTKITHSRFIYNTPEDRTSPAAIEYETEYDIDHDSVRKSSTSSRRSSSGKSPSPERGRKDTDTKISKVTSSVTSRQSKITEDSRQSSFSSRYDTSVSDDTSKRPDTRGPKVTSDETSDDDRRYYSSTSKVFSRQSDERRDSRIRPTERSDDDDDLEHSRDDKYVSKTSTTISQRLTGGKTPASIKRQIFAEDSNTEDRKKTSANYERFSSSSKSNFSRSTVDSSNNLLDSERRFSSGTRRVSNDEKRVPENNHGSGDYDDEHDGYHSVAHYTTRTVAESRSRYGDEEDAPEHVERSEAQYKTSTVTQSRGGVTTTETTSSRSSTPNYGGRRRSSNTPDGERESSPTPSTGSGFSRITRGGSVRALSQKFQQAAGSPNYGKSATTEVQSSTTSRSTTHSESEGKSFLNNQTRVTDVQDVLTRMRNADNDVQEGDTAEDMEARTLLNKFLGAQVILQGMEPLVKASHTQSAALVKQVEQQRVLSSQKITSTATNGKDLEQDLEEIWDERVLKDLLNKCTDYDGRRLIRARLRVVMAEQKACAGVVAAALADEEVAREQEQEESGQLLRRNVEEGESLLLPYLVEQLRSSLLLEKKPAGLPRTYSSQSSAEEGQIGRVEDSGTESGEDLKLLAVGLRDSIEFHRQINDKPVQQEKSTLSATEPLGPGLLQEVQSALSRLQASLQVGGSAHEPEAQILDNGKRDALLQLIARLQASLRLPAPPWGKPALAQQLIKTDSPEPKLHSPKQAQRFGNRRNLRQNRHTVAVTREELADARRLIEQNAAAGNTPSIVGLPKSECSSLQNDERLTEDLGIIQNSAGDLATPANGISISPAVRAFRPVKFTPKNTAPESGNNGNTTAKPFYFLSQLKDTQKRGDIRRTSFDSTGVTSVNGCEESSSKKLDKEDKMPAEENIKTTRASHNISSASNNRIVQSTKDSANKMQLECKTIDNMQPMVAEHREYRPGKQGEDLDRPTLRAAAKNVPIENNIKSEVPLKMDTHGPKSASTTSSSASSNASTPLRSDTGSSLLKSSSSSLDSYSSSKASTPQRSDSGTSVGDKNVQRTVPVDSSLNSGSNFEKIAPRPSIPPSFPTAQGIVKPETSTEQRLNADHHRPVTQTLSLDSANEVKTPHKPISHSLSLDSGSKDYDPSILLFTPAQSVQIAVHKAAINKQISLEEEKRNIINTQKSMEKSSFGSEDSEEVSGEECSSGQSDEDEANTATVLCAPTANTPSTVSNKNVNINDTKNIGNVRNNSSVNSEKHSLVTNKFQQPVVGKLDSVSGYSSQANSGANKMAKSFIMPQEDLTKRQFIKEPNKNTWSTEIQQNRYDSQQNLKSQTGITSQKSGSQQQNHIQNTNSSKITFPNTDEDFSTAQRLLQMATEENKGGQKLHSRSDRKVKMKRANTIDIPKPLNFYEVEGESDYSSGDEYEEGKSGQIGSVTDQHRAQYLALRGPIRVGNANKPLGDKVPPPAFQPKTESDHKFLAFLRQHSSEKGDSTSSEGLKTVTYNPSARGGHHWNNRFTNIKTSFETSAGSGRGQFLSKQQSGPAAARLFWQSADDSVTIMKNSKTAAAANGPKLSRQGSIFLRKLFEQKDQERQEQQSKLPWTEKSTDEGVVVGSLTVAANAASTKGAPSMVLSKKQIFTPPTSPANVQAPININKFSHAPMSAFKPIEKKQKVVPKVEPINSQPWATPSNSGSVKQLVAQKFKGAPLTIPQANILQPMKQQRSAFMPYHEQTKQQELRSPSSPTLPWTRDGTQLEHRILNTAVAKFEGLTGETSPQPVPPPLPRSKSQEKVAIPSSLSGTTKSNGPPRTYIPPSHISNSVQDRFHEKTSQLKQISTIPVPPSLLAPHLIQNYKQTNSDKQGLMYSNYKQQLNENQQTSTEHVPEYSTQTYTTEIDYGTQVIEECANPSPIPQTYTGNMMSRTAVFPDVLGNVPQARENIYAAYPDEPDIETNAIESPDASFPSPEVFMAVSRVMEGPTSHQAVTVTKRTQHRDDEMGLDNRSSAAKNLSSVLTKFSSSNDSLTDESRGKSPLAALSREDQIQAYQKMKSTGSPRNSPVVQMFNSDRQQVNGVHAKDVLIQRHRSEPDVTSMITDDHFKQHQQQLRIQEARNYSGSPIQNRQLGGNDYTKYPQYQSGPGRGSTSQHPLQFYPMTSARVHPASAESLITATSREELQESGESVLTTRLQIPVAGSNGSMVQNLAKLLPTSNRSSSLHDVPHKDVGSKSPKPAPAVSPSISLRKSESWHQLGGRGQRPQSLVLGDTASPVRRVPPSLPKTKSSHSLAFPKQFEAALSPESVENKQRKVEAYLKGSSSPRLKTPELKTKSSSSRQSELPVSDDLILDENLENVDEAFENLFNAAVSGSSKGSTKRITAQKTKQPPDIISRNPHSIEQDFPSHHLTRSASTQFVRKQQAWEESSMVRTKLAQNLGSNDRGSK